MGIHTSNVESAAGAIMSIKVISYRQCLPKRNKKQEKTEALRNFAVGVGNAGDTGVYTDKNLTHLVHKSDVGVILGWVHPQSENTPHLRFRKNVIDQYKALNKRVVSIDSNLFLYKNTNNPLHYLRYSYDGIFPNTGEYCDSSIDPNRWNQLSKDLNISPRGWRQSGSHVLICLQRHGGWSMGGRSVPQWALNVIQEIRQHSDRPIRIRPHPGDKSSSSYLSEIINCGRPNVVMSTPGSTLVDDLQDCWAVVNHNSSPTVGAAIEGVPVFVTDPNTSQCREIANFELSQIENPKMPDRTNWMWRLAMFHWSFDDLVSGKCWSHMRNWAVK